MPTVADVVRRYVGASLERFGDTMPAAHERVLEAIAACRTGELGLVLYRFECCGQVQAMGRSCGDRHCPSCRRDQAEAWLEKQTDRLLPCPYFLVTFTLPAAVRDVARGHQRVAYSALFEASSSALRALAADPKYLGTDRLGLVGVLHTWGRTLEYHPHVHYLVPGGRLGADGDDRLPSRADFFVPAKALSVVFRAKSCDILRREGLLDLVNPTVWSRDWVVHSQAAGDGRQSLRYLAPYVFRVAIGDHRIVSCDDDTVTFAYRRVGSSRPRKMTPDAMEFLRRFLQHVLPAGFQKVRHFGFLSPGSGTSIEAVRWLIVLHDRGVFTLLAMPTAPPAKAPAPRCSACGRPMSLVGFVPASRPVVFDSS
jgi:hypothetical protein